MSGGFCLGPVPQSIPSLRLHIPLIEPDVRISRIRLSDKASRLRRGMQRRPQLLNRLWSYQAHANLPVPRHLCAGLELRSLPSTGITRLQRCQRSLSPKGRLSR